jgi:hypothetical protein
MEIVRNSGSRDHGRQRGGLAAATMISNQVSFASAVVCDEIS